MYILGKYFSMIITNFQIISFIFIVKLNLIPKFHNSGLIGHPVTRFGYMATFMQIRQKPFQ